MCGFIFVEQSSEKIKYEKFQTELMRQKWRGPDSQHTLILNDGRYILGHNRLSIIDTTNRANQPMVSKNGRYVIVYNGEIYNHLEIRRKLELCCNTNSDTETVLEGYAQVGEKIFELIDGMFALVILDKILNRWVAARDAFGIKPLFIGDCLRTRTKVISSESVTVANLINAKPCSLALREWKMIRNPIPGKSYFQDVNEILPGTIVRSDGTSICYWTMTPSEQPFSQEEFEELLQRSVVQHEMSDVKNVSLLSGGLDSAIITALSTVSQSYCVGMDDNNEFMGAKESAAVLGRKINTVSVSHADIKKTWQNLAILRGEPLSVPNEAMIYTICRTMRFDEKVVLTGEGADELLFGYDNIYRWAVLNSWRGVDEFLKKYCYAEKLELTDRLMDYIETLRNGKTLINFVEDFFYKFHLPCLLRRMDFASMAASKEARVPFVNKQIVNYLYRRPFEIKINHAESKIPLRKIAKKMGLDGALERKKIGFSAQAKTGVSRFEEYSEFQSIILEALKW